MPRNSIGNYTLPAGNPVLPDSLIETAWANPTMADLAAGLTDSLDRYGRGGMLAAFKVSDGLATAPGLAFVAASNTGIFRAGTNEMGASVNSTHVMSWIPGGTDFKVSGIYAQGTKIADAKPTGLELATPMLFDNGTAAAPSLTFKSDLDLGLFRSAADVLGLATAGVARMLIDAAGNASFAGNVGVGVTPAARLHSKSLGEILRLEGTSARGAGNTYLSFWDTTGVKGYCGYTGGADDSLRMWNSLNDAVTFGTGGVERMRIEASGNVGIGMAGTNYGGGTNTLGVNANVQSLVDLHVGATRTAYFTTTNVMTLLGSHTAIPLVLMTNGTERIRIDPSGNVAIGLTAPGITGLAVGNAARTGENYIRNVTSTNDLYFGQSSGTVFGFGPGNIGLTIQAAAKPFGVGTVSAQPLILGTSGAAWMIMDSIGIMRHVGNTVGFNVASAGATPDPYGALAVTMPGNATNYSYYSLTRQGQAAWGIGVDTANQLIIGVPPAGGHQVSITTVILRLNQSTGALTNNEGYELGYKDIPQVTVNGAYTIQASDRGKHIMQNAAATITIPNTLPLGQTTTIYSNVAGNITISPAAGLELRWANGSGSVVLGSRTLAPFGVCTFFMIAAGGFAVLTGSGLS